jgi:8-oxo-dGTP diphosphatase
VRDGQVLAGLRPDDPFLGRCWEFPGGKFRPGERPEEAAARELNEETGLECGHMEPLCSFSYDYDDRSLELHCYLVRNWTGTLKKDPARNWSWFSSSELGRLTMPEANRIIISELAAEIGYE